MFLLDVPRDPVSIGGEAGLALIVIVVLVLVAILLVGFVFLLKRLQRRKATAVNISTGNLVQPSRPNQ